MKRPGSFSQEVRAELARLWADDRCCRRAELLGVLVAEGEGRDGSPLSFGHPAVARKVYKLVKDNGWSANLHIHKGWKYPQNRAYELHWHRPDGADDFLSAWERQGPRVLTPKARCCLRAFIRGAFMVRGSLSDPEKVYHMEMPLDDDGAVETLAEAFRLVRVEIGVSERRGQRLLYLKGIGPITEVLALIGAHAAVLKLENVRIMKDMRNRVNRLVNSETANVQKTVDASMAQLDAIALIDTEIGLDALPRPLAHLAKLRRDHPYASLRELGEMCDPKLSKSGVSYRMNNLIQRADQLRYRDDEDPSAPGAASLD